MPEREGYAYCLWRVVPDLARGECLNAGLVLLCRRRASSRRASPRRGKLARSPRLDPAPGPRAPRGARARGGGRPGGRRRGRQELSERFHWLAAPSSTVVQPGVVHTGLSPDPQGRAGPALRRRSWPRCRSRVHEPLADVVGRVAVVLGRAASRRAPRARGRTRRGGRPGTVATAAAIWIAGSSPCGSRAPTSSAMRCSASSAVPIGSSASSKRASRSPMPASSPDGSTARTAWCMASARVRGAGSVPIRRPLPAT
jgi:hypothetical protein